MSELFDQNDPEVIQESALACAQALLGGVLRDTGADPDKYTHLMVGEHDLTIKELAGAMHELGREMLFSDNGKCGHLAHIEVLRTRSEDDWLFFVSEMNRLRAQAERDAVCAEPSAVPTPCAQCDTPVHTCERAEPLNGSDYRCPAHPNGYQDDNQRWYCDEACWWEKQAELLRAERDAGLERERLLREALVPLLGLAEKRAAMLLKQSMETSSTDQSIYSQQVSEMWDVAIKAARSALTQAPAADGGTKVALNES